MGKIKSGKTKFWPTGGGFKYFPGHKTRMAPFGIDTNTSKRFKWRWEVATVRESGQEGLAYAELRRKGGWPPQRLFVIQVLPPLRPQTFPHSLPGFAGWPWGTCCRARHLLEGGVWVFEG